ncbi:hypothetical protein MS3_00002462 [Schistosoma haematobium]|uniref:Uncharacterized protein n=1 Tax=Schistosoma haematobium TaxID=6185 RepID=A0A922M094_SCHHA|nr:hypothetical protein MS3_00002462 [Schistosoma haematobium]KAH9596964.1 hypothetical protein MS3_00002462 [Schistosoma haematobium]
MGENKPDFSGGRNQEEVMEVNRTNIEESTQLHHKVSPHLESSMLNEKRKTIEHITSRNGDSHEKNEQELDKLERKAGWDIMGCRMLVGDLSSIGVNRRNCLPVFCRSVTRKH